MVLVFLADGFEEIEALTTVDVLRRAELEVVTVGIGDKLIRGAHGILVGTDTDDSRIPTKDLQAVVLPGGMPGTLHLEKADAVQQMIEFALVNGALIAAICAAPSILGHKGLLENRRAVCFPGFEEELCGAVYCDQPVVVDLPFVTAKGAAPPWISPSNWFPGWRRVRWPPSCAPPCNVGRGYPADEGRHEGTIQRIPAEDGSGTESGVRRGDPEAGDLPLAV